MQSAKRTAGTASVGGRPTLAIVVEFGWGVRNFLLGTAFERLSQSFDLAIYSPFTDVPGFRERFERPGVAVYPLDTTDRPGGVRALRRLAEVAAWHRYPSGSRVNQLRRLRAQIIERSRRASLPKRIVYRLLRLLLPTLRWAGPPLFPVILAAYRARLKRTSAFRTIRESFRNRGIDGVFSTHSHAPGEWKTVLAARSLGLPAVAAMTSWDNPSSKAFLICDYDAVLAWSERMKEDIIRHMNAPSAERILVTGAPQFDVYRDPRVHLDRGSFCRPLGLDPRRKIVVYTTGTPLTVPGEPELIRSVHEIVARLPGSPQLLIRLHPKDDEERYSGLREKISGRGIAWTLAGVPRMETGDRWCPDPEDLVRAVNTLRHGDVNVHCSYSTMMLDFSLHDKPVVVIAFDPDGRSDRFHFYETFEHLRPVVASGAIPFAYSTGELEDHLRRALRHPDERREDRRRLIESLLGAVDGQAGLRSAEAIIRVMERSNSRRDRRARFYC